MPPIRTGQTQKRVKQEGRIGLAVQALSNNKIYSLNKAACVFEVPRSTLQKRFKGRSYRADIRPNLMKLDAIRRGFAREVDIGPRYTW
jgi:hypothetical protein